MQKYIRIHLKLNMSFIMYRLTEKLIKITYSEELVNQSLITFNLEMGIAQKLII